VPAIATSTVDRLLASRSRSAGASDVVRRIVRFSASVNSGASRSMFRLDDTTAMAAAGG